MQDSALIRTSIDEWGIYKQMEHSVMMASTVLLVGGLALILFGLVGKLIGIGSTKALTLIGTLKANPMGRVLSGLGFVVLANAVQEGPDFGLWRLSLIAVAFSLFTLSFPKLSNRDRSYGLGKTQSAIIGVALAGFVLAGFLSVLY